MLCVASCGTACNKVRGVQLTSDRPGPEARVQNHGKRQTNDPTSPTKPQITHQVLPTAANTRQTLPNATDFLEIR
eukprot:299255-Pleurochrysis_carterae.AAC.1